MKNPRFGILIKKMSVWVVSRRLFSLICPPAVFVTVPSGKPVILLKGRYQTFSLQMSNMMSYPCLEVLVTSNSKDLGLVFHINHLFN